VSDKTAEAELLRWLRSEMQTTGGELLGAGYQAMVHLYRSPFGDVVVKSPHQKSLLAFVSRYGLRREHRVYVRLKGVPGVPRCHGLLDGKHLVLEHIPGPSLRTYDAEVKDRESFFAKLLASIEAIHAAGVAHGDLKRKNNVVVGPNERPYIIDFGVARLRKAGRKGRGGPVFEWVKQSDYNAWAKLKYRRRMGALSPEDAARYQPLRLERLARWLRVPWQKLRRLRSRRAPPGAHSRAHRSR